MQTGWFIFQSKTFFPVLLKRLCFGGLEDIAGNKADQSPAPAGRNVTEKNNPSVTVAVVVVVVSFFLLLGLMTGFVSCLIFG